MENRHSASKPHHPAREADPRRLSGRLRDDSRADSASWAVQYRDGTAVRVQLVATPAAPPRLKVGVLIFASYRIAAHGANITLGHNFHLKRLSVLRLLGFVHKIPAAGMIQAAARPIHSWDKSGAR